MELNSEVAYYILRYHGHLMSEVEWKAQLHLMATMKATMGRSDEAAQLEARQHKVHSQALSEDPQVLDLAKNGFQQFRLTTAARILRDSAEAVPFNHCPVSGKLARTPTARQCRHCGHDWHGR